MATKSFPTRNVLVLSGAAALVGLGAGIVTLAPGLLSNSTSVDDARVAEEVESSAPPRPVAAAQGEGIVAGGLADSVEVAAPAASDGGFSTVWVIPMDAPLGSFPVATVPDERRSCIGLGPETINECMTASKECPDDQLEWLEANAYRTAFPSPAGVWLGVMQFRNAATIGGALTIKDVQAEGEFVPFSSASFTVVCTPYFDGSIGAAATSSVYRPTTIDLSASNVAIFGEPSAFGEDPTAEIPSGAPVVLNLAPGQSAALGMLSKTPAQAGAFTGQLKATVASGSQTETMSLDVGGQSTFTVAYANNLGASLQLHGGAMCPEPVELYPGAFRYHDIKICSLSDFVREQNLD